jgi:1,4-alpha-glucan branching enzyme
MCLRRPGENSVAYVESHDQALVGDKTMIFRLADANMYTDMDKACHNPVIDRAIALHKMIRLFTLAGGGEAYLNFMGNEFGHPEWIDFPREGNGWSFHYCRRQWSLKNNGFLKYQWLGDFDTDMVALTKANDMFAQRMGDLRLNLPEQKVLAFSRGGLLFAFNFHPEASVEAVRIPVKAPGVYTVALCTDDENFGGWNRIAHIEYPSKEEKGEHFVELYLPARTAVVLQEPAKPAEKPKRAYRRRTPEEKAAEAAAKEARAAARAAKAAEKAAAEEAKAAAKAGKVKKAAKTEKTAKGTAKTAKPAEKTEEKPKPARKSTAKKAAPAKKTEAAAEKPKTTRKRTAKKAEETPAE